MDKQREEFEAWASDNGKWPDAVERTKAGAYLLAHIQNQWNAWQAAQAAQPAQPEGWQLVPVEPTVEMLLAYDPSHSRAGFEWGAKQWRRMLSAAPSHSRMDRILDRQRNDRDEAMSVLSAAPSPKEGQP